MAQGAEGGREIEVVEVAEGRGKTEVVEGGKRPTKVAEVRGVTEVAEGGGGATKVV